MKAMLRIILGTMVSASWAQAQIHDFVLDGKRVPQLSATRAYDANDSLLRIGDQGITVQDLEKMARDRKLSQLEDLFQNYSVPMNCLPQGTSAGKAGQVLAEQLGNVPAAGLTLLAEASWYGKQFLPSQDCRETKGVNRIYGWTYVNFVSRVIEKSDLAPARGNLVELNYAHPGFGVIPGLVKALGVYDLMVAVPGKYGPVYIGKTWFGRYQKGSDEGSFSVGSNQTNWYFLDFNDGALKDQAAGK